MLPSNRLLKNESMAKHTTFRVGGPADVCALPETAEELIALVEDCQASGTPFYVLGDGANVLVSDAGIRGMVILTRLLNHIGINGTTLNAGAGAKLMKVAEAARNHRLTGLEFASGIPGTVGGAVYMNAGAYGREVKDVCESVTAYADGKIITLSNTDMAFGYRASFLQTGGGIALSATFNLQPGNADAIKLETETLAAKRRESQPLEYPSAGSTFKRPPGYFAGKLIADCGLKGFSIGGAQVSEKHAGFVINKGGATADDIRRVIEHVQKTVLERFGVELETEVKTIGF